MRSLTESLKIGLILAAVNMAAWAVTVAIVPPYPDWLLQEMKPAPLSEGVMHFEAGCWDCPNFFLRGRGFGDTWNDLNTPLEILSLPAIRATMLSRPERYFADVSVARFAGALLIQWLCIGFGARLGVFLLEGRNRRRRPFHFGRA